MAKKRGFTVNVYEAEEGGYWADCPDLPGCASQGRTMRELRANMAEAITVYLESLAEEAVPQRSQSRPGHPIKSLQMGIATV